MDMNFKQQALEGWQKYFPTTEKPIGVFYSDELCGAEYPAKPADNPRGYTCIFAQLAKIHQGKALAFDRENIGCFGAFQTIFGGEYHEEATVKLLCEIERFKINREQTNLMHDINPKAQPTGHYIIFKPLELLTESDCPEIFVVFAKPDVISALHTLSSFDDTRVDNVIVPFGSGCEGMLSFPMEEARKENPRVVLGGMDTAMRACIKDNLQLFSMPSIRFQRMVANMDASFLNTYIWQGLRKRVEKQ
ncbi:MAG: DUF169 domain-containing protein [Bacteroidales bacterium]|nr:DUF169 domain-containing protein [Bacteroidales bacterium]